MGVWACNAGVCVCVNGVGLVGCVTQDFRTNTKDAVVFLIDARKCMLATNGEGEVFLHNAMRAAVQTLKAKIVATPTDLVGIWFYGTVRTVVVGVVAVVVRPPLAHVHGMRTRGHGASGTALWQE